MISKIEYEDVSVGTGIIGVYQRMPQKLERVFAEFIDNSTQSFIDHKEELIRINKSPVCIVQIDWTKDHITISDNAYGMNRDDFRRALKLNKPKDEYGENSRSKYGMGLKIAAAYLGDRYIIKSSQYGSNESYESEVDIKVWKEENPEQIANKISEISENSHYTRIIIDRLTHKLTTQIDKKLRKNLANIYYNDLKKGDLDIRLNGISIQYIDVELREKESGGEYFSSVEDTFEFDGQKYNYSGYVGILKKASTDDAGFTLSQAGRGIVLNYRPSEIFGKTNSFQYQRLVGHIQLDDDEKWKVTFNKDGFVWDDGLEKAFITSLSSNHEVTEMKVISTKLRKDKPPVITSGDITKSKNKIEKKYEKLSTVIKTNIEIPHTDEPVVKLVDNDGIENVVNITWEGIKYKFDIRVSDDNKNNDWLTLQKKDEDNNEYYIVINGLTEFFNDYNKPICKDLIINFAVALSLARISSYRLGVKHKDSTLFIEELNAILKNSK